MPEFKFGAKQAKRELIWTKLALMSPSGGGKTYSSLRLASGMLDELKKRGLEQNGRILLGNTEQKRGYYYADEFEYDIEDLEAPYSPEKFIAFIQYAVAEKYPILILDSTSPEWEGRGGCLQLHQEAGGTFQSWAKVTPRHNNFLVAMADSPIHIIATMRGNDQYEITEDKKVKKLGVGAQQRKGFEYEFTASFSLDKDTNIATWQKDNTHLFEHNSKLLDENDGRKIINWANSGSGYTPSLRTMSSEETSSEENTNKFKEEILKLIDGATPETMAAYKELYKKYDPSGNPNRVKDAEKQNQLLEEMRAIH